MKALDGLRDVFAQLLSEAPLCDFQKQQYLRKWNAEIKHIEKTYNINCKSNTPTVEEEPKTKADEIRAMSVEELAKWFSECIDCFCPAQSKVNGISCTHSQETCKQAWIDYLKKESN